MGTPSDETRGHEDDSTMAHLWKKAVKVSKRFINFRMGRSDAGISAQHKSKYKCVNPGTNGAMSEQGEKRKLEGGGNNDEALGSPAKKHKGGDVLELPTKELFPMVEATRLNSWAKVSPPGCGLANLGNTCFLNAVLQCLTHTPALSQYLMSPNYTCSHPGLFCMMCELRKHVSKTVSQATNPGSGKRYSAIAPRQIVRNLRNIGRQFRMGRQEDSHEFMRLVVDGMQKSFLAGFPKGLSPRVQETSLIHRIFGGYLQSQVKCSQCGYESNTFDSILDLSLEVRKINNLEQALKSFTMPEILDGDNKYRCSKCKKLVRATKRFTIHHTPNVLVIQLKRFSFGMMIMGGKINNHIAFPLELDVSPFVSKSTRKEQGARYELYGVLVHSGASTHSGHYYCYVKAANNIWYEFDDSSVRQVSSNTVQSQRGYILFYRKLTREGQSLRATGTAAAAATATTTTTPATPTTPPVPTTTTAKATTKAKAKSNGTNNNSFDAMKPKTQANSSLIGNGVSQESTLNGTKRKQSMRESTQKSEELEKVVGTGEWKVRELSAEELEEIAQLDPGQPLGGSESQSESPDTSNPDTSESSMEMQMDLDLDMGLDMGSAVGGGNGGVVKKSKKSKQPQSNNLKESSGKEEKGIHSSGTVKVLGEEPAKLFQVNRSNIYQSDQVGQWDDAVEDEGILRTRDTLLKTHPELKIGRRRRDRQDMEYDKGKVKKVKAPSTVSNAWQTQNPFQDAPEKKKQFASLKRRQRNSKKQKGGGNKGNSFRGVKNW